jgi:hypothetical protein
MKHCSSNIYKKNLNKVDIPWVNHVWNHYPIGDTQATNISGSFLWRDIMKLVDKFIAICTDTHRNDDTILFWNDTWSGITPAKEFPRLHSFALSSLLSVKEVFIYEDITSLL